MEERDSEQRIAPEGTPTAGGDIIGAGTGGGPTAAGTGEDAERADASAEPDVAALVEDLRSDDGEFRVDVTEASEQAGTGTDR